MANVYLPCDAEYISMLLACDAGENMLGVLFVC